MHFLHLFFLGSMLLEHEPTPLPRARACCTFI